MNVTTRNLRKSRVSHAGRAGAPVRWQVMANIHRGNRRLSALSPKRTSLLDQLLQKLEPTMSESTNAIETNVGLDGKHREPPVSLSTGITWKMCLRARGGLRPRLLQRVREHIEVHLENGLSVRALADVAGLSMFHFARAFKQSVGVTPHGYLLQCRVQRVRQLLAETDMSLSEIALACGFSDQSHCSRRFREHFGTTPGSYRWSLR